MLRKNASQLLLLKLARMLPSKGCGNGVGRMGACTGIVGTVPEAVVVVGLAAEEDEAPGKETTVATSVEDWVAAGATVVPAAVAAPAS